jgi:anti-anti-sigma factor
MEVTDTTMNGVTVVEPRGQIDTAGAKPFGDRIVELIRAGTHHMVIDFRNVRYVSSAGFRPLLIAAKMLEDANGKLVLCGVSSDLLRLFGIGRFTELFTICGTRDESIEKAKQT